MINLQFRATLRLIQQIATIERFAGRWDKISENFAQLHRERCFDSVICGSHSSFLLDSTTPPEILISSRRTRSLRSADLINIKSSVFGQQRDKHKTLMGSYVKAHDITFTPSLVNIVKLVDIMTLEPERLTAINTADSLCSRFRTGPSSFIAPRDDFLATELVFHTVSAFLIEKRLKELIDWANSELIAKVTHPLVIIGTFHLLFLHIYPFKTANHRLSLLITWHLLKANNYDFVEYCHISPLFVADLKGYFASLRQAEKTVYGNWSTLNIWLEFFLQTLCDSVEKLIAESESVLSTERLTDTQKRLLNLITSEGALTRAKLVNHTGMNESTIKYNLSVLSQRGYIKRHGGGRTTSYQLG